MSRGEPSPVESSTRALNRSPADPFHQSPAVSFSGPSFRVCCKEAGFLSGVFLAASGRGSSIECLWGRGAGQHQAWTDFLRKDCPPALCLALSPLWCHPSSGVCQEPSQGKTTRASEAQEEAPIAQTWRCQHGPESQQMGPGDWWWSMQAVLGRGTRAGVTLRKGGVHGTRGTRGRRVPLLVLQLGRGTVVLFMRIC